LVGWIIAGHSIKVLVTYLSNF